MDLKTMRIEDDVHKRLTQYARWGDTLSDVVGRMIDNYETTNKGKSEKQEERIKKQ